MIPKTAAIAARPWRPWSLVDLAVLAALLALCLGIGALGAAVTLPAIPGWYAGLEKPPFNPPNAVFGPVWTALYVIIAIAVWRVARAPAAPGDRRHALVWHAVQLTANAAWSWAFFGAKSPALGLAVIAVLLVSLILAIRATATVDRPAAVLLLPYALWVAFASVLNASILVLNA